MDGDRSERIKQQLSWHKRIGRDVNIPAGFHAFRKAKAWGAMVKAVQRHQLGTSHRKLPEPEQIDENFDPFVGVEITPDVGDSVNDDNCSIPGGDDDNDGVRSNVGSGSDEFPNTDDDDDVASNTDIVADEVSAHHISLDPVVDSECEDIGCEGEDADEGDEELMESNHAFAVKLGVVPPRSTRDAGCQLPSPYTAGCTWSREDWSCSYDAVFMAFWSLYEQSSQNWRCNWRERALEWNGPLGENFDHLIILAATPVSIQDRMGWFCRYRDRLRNQLSRKDPGSFPRRGQVPASASRILELLFGKATGPYLEQRLICRSCEESSRAEREICFLALGGLQKDKTQVWLHTIWAEFVNRSKTEAAHMGTMCPHCRGPNEVQDLRMPEVPWIWFEHERSSPVWPSLTLGFDSPTQRLRYSLRVIIYAGGNHFTVELLLSGWSRDTTRIAEVGVRGHRLCRGREGERS
ncbi:hypothetical protein BJ322DRAFT_1113877 [Thelephora terrestris]|uniref:Uncharacterized protein n=1 Tax=Thelephora terrestris TaxID=56493 RepID=A0A9P6L1Y3_9AGAM|nr:hypothetical protein BJ322DRAFT_1113877 [Thelephora terrestris]